MSTPVASLADLLARLHDEGARLRRMGVARLGVFGSFARAEQRPDSDVDLLVELAPDAYTFDHFMALSFYLEDLVGRRVELVTPASLSPTMHQLIRRELRDVAIAA